jgi:hypothetical protein
MVKVLPEVALQHAIFHLALNASERQHAAGLRQLVAGSITPAPTAFFDILRRAADPVIYVFDITADDNVVGRIAISGSRALKTTLVSIAPSAQSILQDLEEAKIALHTQCAGDLSSFRPVVYSYPKLGVATTDGTGAIWVADLASKEVFLADFAVSPSDLEGRVCWSFWDEYPQAGATNAWQNENDFINAFVSNQLATLSLSGDTEVVARLLLRSVRREIEHDPPTQISTVLPVPLIGQINNIFCAVASLEMIYKYVYGADLDPTEVASRMRMTPSGAGTSGQLAAYESYFGADFDVSIDRTPNYETLRANLETFLPVKSGILGHARTAVGVRRDIFFDRKTGSVKLETQALLVNDPEPIGTGSTRWESIASAGLTDFIKLRRK